MLESRRWGDAKLVVRRSPAFARERNSRKELPTHCIARLGDSSQILFSCAEDVLDIFPAACEAEDCDGHLPVELLGFNEDDAAIEALLPLFLGAVPRTELRFRTAFAHSRILWHRWDDVVDVVASHPGVASRCFDGTYALHVATEQLAPFSVLLDILMADETIAFKVRLPSICCSRNNNNKLHENMCALAPVGLRLPF